jgi:hypothetical protein
VRRHGRELSGPAWCARFPGDATTASLALPWRRDVQRFIASLEAGGARVRITSTYRPPERAWLMHWSWRIAAGEVGEQAGIPIRWEHPDRDASIEAARQMVQAYGIAHRPAIESRHTERLAIDMAVRWTGWLTVTDARGQRQRLDDRRGLDLNPELWRVGSSYGVHKLRTDKPHWSSDGR